MCPRWVSRACPPEIYGRGESTRQLRPATLLYCIPYKEFPPFPRASSRPKKIVYITTAISQLSVTGHHPIRAVAIREQRRARGGTRIRVGGIPVLASGGVSNGCPVTRCEDGKEPLLLLDLLEKPDTAD